MSQPVGAPVTATPPRQRPWVVFGTQGKTKEQLASAVRAGFRRFDTAESYGNIKDLARAVSEAGLARDDYEVLYKFDVADPATLGAHLREVASLFAGKLDAAVIHNVDSAGPDEVKAAWAVLQDLKEKDVVQRIGVGNVSRQAGLLMSLGKIDVVEQSLEHMRDQSVREAIKDTDAELYYYDVIRTAREIGLDVDKPEDLRAFNVWLSNSTAKSSMIMSSGDEVRQQEAVKNFALDPRQADDDVNYESLGLLDQWIKAKPIQRNDESFQLPGELRGVLEGLTTPDGAEKARRRLGVAKPATGKISEWFAGEIAASGQGKVAAAQLKGLLTTTRVPARTGLLNRYVGMSLGEVLEALLGDLSCDWKWSSELVQLMLISVADWNGFPRDALEITDKR